MAVVIDILKKVNPNCEESRFKKILSIRQLVFYQHIVILGYCFSLIFFYISNCSTYKIKYEHCTMEPKVIILTEKSFTVVLIILVSILQAVCCEYGLGFKTVIITGS